MQILDSVAEEGETVGPPTSLAHDSVAETKKAVTCLSWPPGNYMARLEMNQGLPDSPLSQYNKPTLKHH